MPPPPPAAIYMLLRCFRLRYCYTITLRCRFSYMLFLLPPLRHAAMALLMRQRAAMLEVTDCYYAAFAAAYAAVVGLITLCLPITPARLYFAMSAAMPCRWLCHCRRRCLPFATKRLLISDDDFRLMLILMLIFAIFAATLPPMSPLLDISCRHAADFACCYYCRRHCCLLIRRYDVSIYADILIRRVYDLLLPLLRHAHII